MKKNYILLTVCISMLLLLYFGAVENRTEYAGVGNGKNGTESEGMTDKEKETRYEKTTENEEETGYKKTAEKGEETEYLKSENENRTLQKAFPEEENENIENIPNISRVRAICELATLECYYHNVAKAIKEKGKGFAHIGERERKFWIEYDGIVRLGIDASKVGMVRQGEKIIITIPEAKVLGMSDYSFAEGYYVSSEDGVFNKNEITAQDQTKALAEADRQVRIMFSNDGELLAGARERAKELIENYIYQLNEGTGTDYRIEWVYEESLP